MELLDSSKNKISVIDETTAFVKTWGKDGTVFGFYTSKQSKGTVTERTLTIYKIEGLKGYFIKTDGGREIALGSDINAIPEILKSVGISVGNTLTVSSEVMKKYFKADTNDKMSIDLVVNINLPTDVTDSNNETVTLEETTVNAKFKRSINKVTVKDVIEYMNSYEKIPSIKSHMIIGVCVGESDSATEETMLSNKDAILEDQTVSLVWGPAVEFKYARATSNGSVITADSEITGTIKVPYNSTVADAIKILKSDTNCKKAYVSPEEADSFLGEYSEKTGKRLTKSELKKNVNAFAEDTVQIVWLDSDAKVGNKYKFTSYNSETNEQLAVGTVNVSKVEDGKTTVTVETNSVDGFTGNNYVVNSTVFVTGEKYTLYTESNDDTGIYVIIG